MEMEEEGGGGGSWGVVSGVSFLVPLSETRLCLNASTCHVTHSSVTDT